MNIIQDVRLTSHNNLKTYYQVFTATKRVNNQATGGIDLAKANSSRTGEEERARRKLFHFRTLKWKSQETMKAKIITASKKFITRRPCQVPRVSV